MTPKHPFIVKSKTELLLDHFVHWLSNCKSKCREYSLRWVGWEACSIVNQTDYGPAESLVIWFSYCSLSTRGAPRVRGWSPYCKYLHGRNQTLPGEITCYRFYCPLRRQIWLETSTPVSRSWRIWSASSADWPIRPRTDHSLVSSWRQLGSALLFVATNLNAVSHPLSK